MVVSERHFDLTGHLHQDPAFEISHTVVVPQLVILYREAKNWPVAFVCSLVHKRTCKWSYQESGEIPTGPQSRNKRKARMDLFGG